MWQPDGWAFRARLGLLVPHAAIGSESEIGAMAPEGVSIHATRVPLGVMRAGGLMDPTIATDPVAAFADPPLIDDAAALLADAPLHAIGMAFNASSYVRGVADDSALKQRLEQRTRGIPVALTSDSAAVALRALKSSNNSQRGRSEAAAFPAAAEIFSPRATDPRMSPTSVSR